MARSPFDVQYRGCRRWNGSHGKVWWDNELLFEIEKFEVNVEPQREDVLIGNSVDSKIVSLKGTGTITIKSVINRNLNKFLEEWKAGHDPRTTLVGLLEDPDMIDAQKERVSIDNVWFNKLDLMSFEKGKVVEKEYPFGFTPEDTAYVETVE
ncbi:terminase [Megasphaera sp. AM44-1BH]|uniref:phage tail tube protein n=1 Tax=Megasphaera sp. AM44-1BH TaxID=2292358 RepID=UPI000E4B9773|nr:phage tail tube protein [Megasphaera sp. AM44-1BH]RHA11748.1 terminase [Megasphaera sp. AM44-1BH]